MEWETVIGLEVHAQLMTKSKIFSGASTEYGAEPNAQACAIDLGLPGVLPVLNEKAVEMAIRFGLASNSKIASRSVFARKNYFYPDLPKGYQISQFDLPIVHDGHMDIIMADGTKKRIGITRAHLEEDAGKSLHEDFHGMTGVDLNRAGIALLEIVSEPDMRSAEEAIVYLKTLHTLVKYLGICDGNMQEGSFRCDANVSVRPKGQKEFGTRCEIKNVNSFKFVEQAIEYEVARQIDVIENGGTIRQQTRLYDSVKKETRPMRDKEEANDYRYFPCPDLLPVVIDAKQIDKVMQTMPELPQQKLDRFVKDLGLSTYDAGVITASKALADFYEDVLNKHDSKEFAKLAANWITGELLAALNKHNLNIEESPVSAKQMNQLLQRISDETISGKIAKTLFESLWLKEGDDVDALIESKGLKQVTDTGAIEKVIKDIMAQYPEQLADYRSGKDKLFGFFVGQVMKESKGKANPGQVNDLLKKLLQG